MSEEVINSAFSFSDISEDLEILEEEKNGKFIKTWKININLPENEAQLEEEIAQEDSQIAIKEEYEIYGKQRPQNIRLKKRTFYNKNDPTKIEYYEVFEPSRLEGNYVSKLLQPEGSYEFGYRCYKNGINNITNSNDYFTIVKPLSSQDMDKIQPRYSVFCEPEIDCVDIMKNIYTKMFEDSNTSISGNLILTEAFVAAQQDANKRFADETIKKIGKANTDELSEILGKEPLDVVVSLITNTINAVNLSKKTGTETTNEKIGEVFAKAKKQQKSSQYVILDLFNRNHKIFLNLKKNFSEQKNLELSNPNLLIDKPLDSKSIALFYRLTNYIKNPEINCKYIAFPFGIPEHETVALFDFEKTINIITEKLREEPGKEELSRKELIDFFSKNLDSLIEIDIQKILSENINYFDSSTYNCNNYKKESDSSYVLHPKKDYFNELNCSLIRVFNKNIQINGTCSHWSMCFLNVLSEDQMKPQQERKYDNIEKINQAFENGSMQLDICIKMGDIFGETIKYYGNGNEQPMGDDNGYLPIKLKINNQPEEFAWYGINKQCHRNRFVDIENLINSLGGLDEGKKTELKEQFQFHIKYQTINKLLSKFYDYNYKYERTAIIIEKLKNDILKSQKDAEKKELQLKINSIENFKNNFEQFLEQHSFCKTAIDMFGKQIDEIGIVDDYDINSYSVKYYETNPKFIIAAINSNSIMTNKSEFINIEIPEILNNYGYANTVATKDTQYEYFDIKKNQKIEQPKQLNSNPPAEIKSAETHKSQPSLSKTKLSKTLSVFKIPENMKKPSSQPITFLERENIRRQNKIRTSSTQTRSG